MNLSPNSSATDITGDSKTSEQKVPLPLPTSSPEQDVRATKYHSLHQSSPIFASVSANRHSKTNDTPDTSIQSPESTPRTSPIPVNIAEDVLNIAEHSQTELLIMLSSLLMKITYSNDNLHTNPEATAPPIAGSPLLAFHARNIPSISIQSYLIRILKYCPMSSDIFLSLLVYFDRMSRVPDIVTPGDDRSTFTSSRQLMGDVRHPFSIDSYNVHRLVITGIVVASKFCSDVFYTNSRYAKVGGLPLSELNHLEFQFLLMNDFRLMIPMEELQKYGNQLLSFWRHENSGEERTK